MAYTYNGSTQYSAAVNGTAMAKIVEADYSITLTAKATTTASRLVAFALAYITGSSMGNPGQGENHAFAEFNGPSFGASPCVYGGGGQYPPSAAESVLSPVHFSANVWSINTFGLVTYGGTAGVRMCGDGSFATGATVGLTPGAPKNGNTYCVGSDYYGTNTGGFFSNGFFFSGTVGSSAYIGIKLTDRQMTSLAAGISPARVAPNYMNCYFPMINNPTDRFSRRTLTHFNTPTLARHHRQYGY